MEKHQETFLQIVNHIITHNPELIEPIRNLVQHHITKAESGSLSAREIFSKIYRDKMWGNNSDPTQLFFSGPGSHSENIVNIYVHAISNFLNNFVDKPNVLDLGCGDFNIGSKIRKYCGSYIACDIVSELIQYNQRKYADLNVDFREIDLIEDTLPKADIIFVRQVLQHLSNAQIEKFLPKLKDAFSWLILTEHVPLDPNFEPNVDQSISHNIRLFYNSGVVVTKHPFNLNVAEQKVLCEAYENNGLIRTIAYRL